MDKYTEPEFPKSALITIDMQEDFSRKGVRSFIKGTEEIIPDLLKIVQYYRSRHWPVIHIIRLYHYDGSNADICRQKAIEHGKSIVVPNSEGAEIVSELKPDTSTNLDFQLLLKSKAQKLANHEWVMYKPRWGAFFKTGLNNLLQKLNISTLVITGCNFPNCPRTTIYEASERDYRIVLVSNAVSGIYPRAEKELQNIGVAVCNTDEIINNL